MWLVKGAPNLMQRLSRLPPVPNVTLLDRRKPKSLSWPHANTTFTQQTYIRWCCIDLLRPPRLPDKWPQCPVMRLLGSCAGRVSSTIRNGLLTPTAISKFSLNYHSPEFFQIA